MALERTRRRALQIFVGSAACALTRRAGASPYQWRGAALGADVSILFSDTLESRAERAVASILDEVERLEAIFSLQRLDSELSRLNATGRLQAPSPDFLHVLSLAAQAHRMQRAADSIPPCSRSGNSTSNGMRSIARGRDRAKVI